MKENYDLIFIDMPNEINTNTAKELLRISNKNIIMGEPNLLGISKLNRFINQNVFKYNLELKESSYICFNKYSNQSIDKNIIKSIFSEYKFLTTLNYDIRLEKFINKGNIYYRELTKKNKTEYEEIIKTLFLLYKSNRYPMINCYKRFSLNTN